MVLEIAISIRAISNWEICHSKFNFYCLPKERKEIRVVTAVRKDLRDKIMVDYRTDFIHHQYFILFEICKLNFQLIKPGRKTEVVNVNDNQVERGYT